MMEDKKGTLDGDQDAESHNNQGVDLAAQEKYGEAVDEYKLAIASDPNNFLAYYNWGFALEAQEKYDEAQKPGGVPLPGMHTDSYAPLPDPSIRTGVRTMSLGVMSLLPKK